MNCFDCNAISGLIMDAILIEHSLIITNNLCENGWHFLYNKSIPINQIKKYYRSIMVDLQRVMHYVFNHCLIQSRKKRILDLLNKHYCLQMIRYNRRYLMAILANVTCTTQLYVLYIYYSWMCAHTLYGSR